MIGGRGVRACAVVVENRAENRESAIPHVRALERMELGCHIVCSSQYSKFSTIVKNQANTVAFNTLNYKFVICELDFLPTVWRATAHQRVGGRKFASR